MSPVPLSGRRLLATTAFVLAAAIALPALAEAPKPVVFEGNAPWAQEVGAVSHADNADEYTVSVDAGKTLQVNLISRNPNIFFSVKPENERKPLVDTMKTGATSWSVPVTTATTYRIKVYADRAVLPRGDSSKYALQVGQYGAADMQAATTEVAFADNNPWAQETGRLDAQAPMHDYAVAVAAGNTLQVNLVARDPGIHFKVEDAAKNVLVDSATTGATTWSTQASAAGTYTIHVYIDPAAVPPGKADGYALQVGRYTANVAQPAGAATTAASAAAGSAALPADHRTPVAASSSN